VPALISALKNEHTKRILRHQDQAARSASAYCNRVDSEWSSTCCLLDWRTYSLN